MWEKSFSEYGADGQREQEAVAEKHVAWEGCRVGQLCRESVWQHRVSEEIPKTGRPDIYKRK